LAIQFLVAQFDDLPIVELYSAAQMGEGAPWVGVGFLLHGRCCLDVAAGR
jgi:hypothetical protein